MDIKENEELKESIYYYMKALEGLERDLLFRKIAVELVNNSNMLSVIKEKENSNGKEITHSLICDVNDNEFLPLFTDTLEMNKWIDMINLSNGSAMIEVFDFYAKVIRDNQDVKGIVINPCNDNGFVITRETIEFWYDGVELNYISFHVKDKIINVLKKNIEVDKAWISINDNNKYKVVVIAYDGIDTIKKDLSEALELDDIEVVLFNDENPETSEPIYIREKPLFN